MGWKCTDCGDRGPEHDIRWCPHCGSTSWQPTDADGLTAGDRADQAEMLREAIADERAQHIFGYVALFTSAVMAFAVALLFFHDSIWCTNVAIAVFVASVFVASLLNEDDTLVLDHIMFPWETILHDARNQSRCHATPPPPRTPAPTLDETLPF